MKSKIKVYNPKTKESIDWFDLCFDRGSLCGLTIYRSNSDYRCYDINSDGTFGVEKFELQITSTFELQNV